MSVEVQVHTAPNFKGLISGIEDVDTLGQFDIRTVAIFRLKFRRFLVIFSKITQFSEMLYTSLESPNIQLLENVST